MTIGCEAWTTPTERASEMAVSKTHRPFKWFVFMMRPFSTTRAFNSGSGSVRRWLRMRWSVTSLMAHRRWNVNYLGADVARPGLTDFLGSGRAVRMDRFNRPGLSGGRRRPVRFGIRAFRIKNR
jgi:hypothetical protein